MLRELLAAAPPSPLATLSLAGGLPPTAAFPFDALAAAAARLLGSREAGVLQYEPTEGDPRLLELLAPYLSHRVGGADVGGRVVVTTGSQQALDLVARLLVDPGDPVIVESPTYIGALRALAAYEPQVVSVPVDENGIDTARLARLLDDGLRPKLCYLVPNFSNPTGATTTAERRVELAELAGRYGFLVVEDDPYRDLRFRGADLPAVAAFGEQVVYVGSFSKVVAPGLRVGYLVAPEPLVAPLLLAKQAADLSSSSFNQRLVAELLADDGWLEAHLDELRGLYRARADALTGAIRRLLPGRLETNTPDGGMFCWTRITALAIDAATFARACAARGVIVVPGAEFTLDGTHPRDVRLSFSMLSPDDLEEAVQRMVAVFDDLSASGAGT